MYDNQIIENNTLIAQFMGLDEDNRYVPTEMLPHKDYNLYQGIFEMRELQFHISWDWLMPVVEKIESLEFNGRSVWTTIKTFKTSHKNNYHEMMFRVYKEDGESFLFEYDSEWFDTKITAVYFSVIEFIKWYNLNK